MSRAHRIQKRNIAKKFYKKEKKTDKSLKMKEVWYYLKDMFK